MARAPYNPVRITEPLRPQAQAVDTFVRAPQPVQDNSLMDLARGLSKLDSGLSSFVAERKAARDEEDAIRGEAEFHKNNQEGFAEAVASGKIPAYASQSFVRAYKAAQGSVAGAKLEEEFAAAYDSWGDKGSDDPAKLDEFMGGFLKSRIQTDDPDILRGLLPRLRRLTDTALNRNSRDRHERVMGGLITSSVAEADNAIDEAHSTGKGRKEGTDYETLFASVTAIRSKATAVGAEREKMDNGIIDLFASKALQLRDPKFLDFLERNVPGTNHTWADTAYGRTKKAETINALETMGRRAIEEEAKATKEANKAALDGVTRRTIEAVIANPTAPLPDELLKEGTKLSPDFKVDVMKWQESVLRNRGAVDPEELMNLNWEIINGGGVASIKKGLELGLFGNKDDLVSAYKLVEDLEKGGKDLRDILKSSSVSALRGAINLRTQDKNSVENLFNPEGITNKGLAAQYDLDRAIMRWRADNPKAGPLEQEKAISEIGAQILGRIEQKDGGLGDSTYSAGPGNPYAAPQAPTQQPAPAQPSPAQPQQPSPAQPTPPAPAQPTVDPAAVKSWWDSLTPELRASAEKRAKDTGQDLQELITKAYQQGVTRGVITPSANPPQPAEAPQRTGALELPVELAAAGETIMNQVAEAFAAWDENAPVGDDIVQQVGSAIEAALRGGGATKGNYTLAVLKDDPRAARILDFISGPESNGNYSAVWGRANNKEDLSKFTVDEILERQRQTVARGGQSAIGRYQFIRKTLAGLKTQMGLTGEERFTPELQDRMAVQLLRARGYDRWVSGKMSTTTFANNLAKEWASLPNLRTGRSHYAGDGLNKAHVSPTQVLQALDPDTNA